ncbi:MAG TPA: hypothetical protein VIS74_07390, partial [Chthoniobacterales bacterium]
MLTIPTPSRRNSAGFALLLALVMIVLATVLAVAFLTSSRINRSASNTTANSERIDLAAQSAVEHAVGILDSNIPQPRPPGAPLDNPVNWITSPGLLTLVDGSGTRRIPLSSNPDSTYTPSRTDADLNSRLLRPDASGQRGYPIAAPKSGDSLPLRVAWVNLLQNPALPASAANPIVARYGFWIDDESTRLNLNMAYGKPARALNYDNPHPLCPANYGNWNGREKSGTPQYGPAYFMQPEFVDGTQSANALPTNRILWNTGEKKLEPTKYPLWHPASLELPVLNAAGYTVERDKLTDWIHNKFQGVSFQYQWRTLASPIDVLQYVKEEPPLATKTAAAAAFWRDNQFNITTTGRSPEFNVWGKSRLFMEREMRDDVAAKFYQGSYDKDGPAYFGAETSAGTYDSAPTATRGEWYPNLSGLYAAANSISNLLNRNDWPGLEGASFVDKWGGGELGKREADQVAWNIAIMGAYSPSR